MMQQVEGKYPPPHSQYLVQRGRSLFIATPCYGMHSPWWVPDSPTGETEPINILADDKWMPIDQVIKI